MKVALDATPLTLSSGGLPRYVAELSVALAAEFPEDTYSLLSDQPFHMPTTLAPNLVRGRAPLSLAERRWWFWGIRRAIQQNGAQVFHGTNFEVPYLSTVPAILTIHDLSPWRDKNWHDEADRVRFRAPWLVRLRRARRILTVSDAVRAEIIEHFNVSPDLVRAVPLAASPRFRPLAPAPPRKPFFLFVGTLEPRKNVASLVEAWYESRDQTHADLIIAGRNRADFAGLPTYEGLYLLGEVPDEELPRLYSDALAFVYPTHYEGFGLPVLEAMQCGCPVITSRDPAIKEVAGGAALHTTSTREIAEAMCALAVNPALRSDLRLAGLTRSQDFSWSRTARETRADPRGTSHRQQLVATMKALMLSPEPPYPLNSGGAYRTASLLHYLAQIADVDLILISDSGQPALLPPGLVSRQDTIPLPLHSKTPLARVLRNARRAIRSAPPLIDRLANLELPLKQILGNQHYDIGVIEHFWCAQYIDQISDHCSSTVLDLHNVESVLHSRCAAVSNPLVAAGHRRFAHAYARLEAEYLPRFSQVLATSDNDARTINNIAPTARVSVYPNAFPDTPQPSLPVQNRLVFSGNFEYHPNIDAVHFLAAQIWPAISKAFPSLEMRLIGRGNSYIQHLLEGSNIQTTGQVPNALDEIAQAIVVLAPLRAGSGTRLKIIEAWAAGRPVIATPLAAEGLTAVHRENILLATEANDFLAAVTTLLTDPDLRERIARAGRRTFEDQYSWNAAWSTLDLRSQLIQRHCT